MVSVFGIRHHGPGSTKSLLRALDKLQPDLVLIEGPPDADKEIEYVANPELKPPVALLVYNPKDLSQAAYYPFAAFSPEWQAMKFALQRKLPVRFMDLPQAMHFGLNQMEKDNIQLPIDQLYRNEPAPTPEQIAMRKDPMGFAARASGYTDSERWWEMLFEREENTDDIFPAITELIENMRADLPAKSKREQLREAYMRNVIRKAEKEGFQNIAVVCGAWHAPVLQHLNRYTQKSDNALLKGIKKIKTAATWVPWTFNRLAMQSGYNSGVISPAYYDLLFSNSEDFVIRWMSKVAQLLRSEDLDASSAHAIEAVRLANTLSTIRGNAVAGLDELYEAAISIFCEGHDSKMKLIEKKLIIGDRIGDVPTVIPVIPLQKDLEAKIKTARLSKEWKSPDELVKELDLRKASNLVASHLLHRLHILGIPWGKQQNVSKRSTGSFKEIWKLEWLPDFAISIIEAGMWGNTVLAAANNYVVNKAQEAKTLPELTGLVGSALNADLPEAVQELVHYLRDRSALTKDVEHLLLAMPALVDAVRYGSTRQIDISALEAVIENMVPRICIALPNACVSVDEAATKDLFESIIEVNNKLNILNNEDHLKSWYQALERIVSTPKVNGLLRGSSTRMLFDKEYFDIIDTVTKMRYSLSAANETMDAARWIEGFLYGSGLLLIHQPDLWNILDEWIDELPMDNFKELLPILRRTFSAFSGPERAKMLTLAKHGQLTANTSEAKDHFNEERAELVLPTIRLLLGIK